MTDINGVELQVGDLITCNQFSGTGKVIDILDKDGNGYLRVLHHFTSYNLRIHISQVCKATQSDAGCVSQQG